MEYSEATLEARRSCLRSVPLGPGSPANVSFVHRRVVGRVHGVASAVPVSTKSPVECVPDEHSYSPPSAPSTTALYSFQPRHHLSLRQPHATFATHNGTRSTSSLRSPPLSGPVPLFRRRVPSISIASLQRDERHRAPSTEHRAPSTEHRAKRTIPAAT